MPKPQDPNTKTDEFGVELCCSGLDLKIVARIFSCLSKGQVKREDLHYLETANFIPVTEYYLSEAYQRICGYNWLQIDSINIQSGYITFVGVRDKTEEEIARAAARLSASRKAAAARAKKKKEQAIAHEQIASQYGISLEKAKELFNKLNLK